MFSHPVGKFHKLCYRELFCAGCEEWMLCPTEISEDRFEGVAEHFAALTERSLDNFDKKCLVAVELCRIISTQADNSISYHACSRTLRIPYSLEPGGSAIRTATSF